MAPKCNCSHPIYTDYLDNFAPTAADMCHFMPPPGGASAAAAVRRQYACVAEVAHRLDEGNVSCATCQSSCK